MKPATIESVDKTELLFRLAGSLLKEQRELSLEDIRAIPLVETQENLNEVVNYLLTEFNAELIQRSVTKDPFLRWERVIRLRD